MKKITLMLMLSVFALFSIQAQTEQVDPATKTKTFESVQKETTVVQDKDAKNEVREVQAVEKRKVSKSEAMKVKQMKNASTDVSDVNATSKEAAAGKKACCATASKNGKACCSSKGMSGKSCSGKGMKSKSASSKQQELEQ